VVLPDPEELEKFYSDTEGLNAPTGAWCSLTNPYGNLEYL